MGSSLPRRYNYCNKHTAQNSWVWSYMHHHFFLTAIKGSVCKYSKNSLVYPPDKCFLQCVGKGQDKLLAVSVSLFSSRKFSKYDARTDFSSLPSLEDVPPELLHSLSKGLLWFNELRFTFKVYHFKIYIIIKVQQPFTGQKQLQLTADVQISSWTAIGSTLPCVFSRLGLHMERLLRTLILTPACHSSSCSGLCCVISSCCSCFCVQLHWSAHTVLPVHPFLHLHVPTISSLTRNKNWLIKSSTESNYERSRITLFK